GWPARPATTSTAPPSAPSSAPARSPPPTGPSTPAAGPPAPAGHPPAAGPDPAGHPATRPTKPSRSTPRHICQSLIDPRAGQVQPAARRGGGSVVQQRQLSRAVSADQQPARGRPYRGRIGERLQLTETAVSGERLGVDQQQRF